ncbi:hypothetical protein Barb4_03219 [Bacteroidales bacterium Barb4]|nr:hypothetical protein Barb4_03219 [Bacteroidales bacterium Barb4]
MKILFILLRRNAPPVKVGRFCFVNNKFSIFLLLRSRPEGTGDFSYSVISTPNEKLLEEGYAP